MDKRTINIILDVIVIILVSVALIYFYVHLQEFKTLSSDVCRLCEAKTGGICQSNNFYLP